MHFENEFSVDAIIQMITSFYMDKASLYMCGSGSLGMPKLGRTIRLQTEECCNIPTIIPSLSQLDFIDISLPRFKENHNLAIDKCGDIYLWSLAYPKPKKMNFDHIAKAVSDQMILTETGQLFNVCYDRTVIFMECLSQHHIVQISVGGTFQGCISDKGLLFLWGSNENGQCGVGGITKLKKKKEIAVPTRIQLFDNDKTELMPSYVECGHDHCFLITTNGLVMAWGSAAYGKLADGRRRGNRFTPKVIEYLNRSDKIVDIAAGCNHSFCVDEKDVAWSWGKLNPGALGVGWFSEINHSYNVDKYI